MTSRRGASEHLGAGEAARSPRSSGLTLLELLTVLAILTILGGLTAGAFQIARRNFALSASVAQVEALLLKARNTAITGGIPARVVVEPLERKVTAYAFETLGEWSFETERGLFNDPLAFNGAAIVTEGYIGRGVDIGDGHVDCGALPRFDARFGLHVEAWIQLDVELAAPRRIETPSAGAARSTERSTERRSSRSRRSERASSVSQRDEQARPVVSKGGAYFLGVAPDGAVEGGIGEYRVRTAAGVVHPQMWMKIALRFDGESIALIVDGIDRPASPVGFESLKPSEYPPVPRYVMLDPSPLLIGGTKTSFPGLVDEVRLRGMVEPQEYELGPREQILGWKKVIWFDRRGHLDPRYHERPVRLLFYHEPLEDSPSGKTEVFIDYSKTFREWAAARELDLKQEGITEEIAEERLESRLDAELREELVIDRIGSVR